MCTYILLIICADAKYRLLKLLKYYLVVYVFFNWHTHKNKLWRTCENLNPKHMQTFMILLKLRPRQHQVKAQLSSHMTYTVNHCLRPWLEEMAIADDTMET